MKARLLFLGVVMYALCIPVLYAQSSISVHHTEPLAGNSALWSFTLENLGTEPQSIGLRLSEREGGSLRSSAELRRVLVPPGVHTPQSLGIVNPGVIRRYGSNGGENGITEICVEVIFEDGRVVPFCSTLMAPGRMPPMLVFPFDGDTIDGPVPSFSWLPPNELLGTPGVSYSLRMVEIRRGQTKETAVVANPALIQQAQLIENLWNYPMSAPPFEEGKHYAWQIAAYVNGVYYGRSEVWEFVESTQQPAGPGDPPPMFWDVDRSSGGVYVARGYIGIMSSHGLDASHYEFHILADDEREVRIRKNQIETLNRNQVMIHLPAGSGIRPKLQYTLVIEADGRARYHIPFVYTFSE